MVYAKYGTIFKMLREERQLSLSSFIDLGLTKSTLGRFEHGETMLSFEALDEALQYMNVTMYEYSYFLNNGQNDSFIEAFEEIDNAFYMKDQKRLESI
ncbi:MAG: helix-turn-helix domain-containing protein, partial [Streptococcaceae bacterium]|nr:helix-turn-helix domain-containing protein [Streptococcaceae bacterium]